VLERNYGAGGKERPDRRKYGRNRPYIWRGREDDRVSTRYLETVLRLEVCDVEERKTSIFVVAVVYQDGKRNQIKARVAKNMTYGLLRERRVSTAKNFPRGSVQLSVGISS